MVPDLGTLNKNLCSRLWLHNIKTKLRETNIAVQIMGCKRKKKSPQNQPNKKPKTQTPNLKNPQDSVDLKKET